MTTTKSHSSVFAKSLFSKSLFSKTLFAKKSTSQFALLVSLLLVALNNWPVWQFIGKELGLQTWAGWQTQITVTAVIAVFTGTLVYLAMLLSVRLTKALVVLLLLTNACALYFIETYQVILDKTMIGNILNTQTSESSQYFSLTLVVYLVLFGLLPSLWVIKTPVTRNSRWRLLGHWGALLAVSILWIWSASSTWLWIDKHGKVLGGTILPWSYVVNSSLYYQEYAALHAVQMPLPDATVIDDEKSVVVLVIGESARARNHSLYGYDRPTSPKLSQRDNLVALPNARSCASYTTAAIACMLAHDKPQNLSENFETLPTYLQRQGVEVIWRTKNWGESPITVSSYLTGSDLEPNCREKDCDYDGVLLTNLAEQINASTANKVFVVLHQTGSHGPAYFKKYPPEFEQFSPVCESVELGSCSPESLINAYDNTILYTDDLLDRLAVILDGLPVANTAFLYMSDHGESLGENGLYLHGTPYSLAPDVQLEVPFFVWMSEAFKRHHQIDLNKLGQSQDHEQDEIFHSVLGALGLTSEIYRSELDIFAQAKQ